MIDAEINGQNLRKALSNGSPLIMPDAYDALSAKMIERAGFDAVQCSGFSMALAGYCKLEETLGRQDNLDITRRIIEAVSVPVMADGEDGYGDLPQVAETVRLFIEAGAAGINIEDQNLNGPEDFGPIAPPEIMIEKIGAARDARAAMGCPSFVLNARTDALALSEDRQDGLLKAAGRAGDYLDAGADLAFIVGVQTLEEAEWLIGEVDGPLSLTVGLPYNLETLPLDGLMALKPARISLPLLPLMAAMGGLETLLEEVKQGRMDHVGMGKAGELLGDVLRKLND